MKATSIMTGFDLSDDIIILPCSSSLSSSSSSSRASTITTTNTGITAIATAATTTTTTSKSEFPNQSLKLIIGAMGIYVSHIYHGSLQEDVFLYRSNNNNESSSNRFEYPWFLQTAEAVASTVLGLCGLFFAMGGIGGGVATTATTATTTATKGLPLFYFWCSGAAQVAAKVCSNMALTAGLSYPTVVLAKSAKLFPVMVGSWIMGGASYDVREYVQVLAIVAGTCIVLLSTSTRTVTSRTLSQSSSMTTALTTSTIKGLAYIFLALLLDGAVAGFQKRLQRDTARIGIRPTTYDFMFWMSVPMALIAGFVSLCSGELNLGIQFCLDNPEMQSKIVRISCLSAIGQFFVFYTLAHFDPLILSIVTTTRKILSVLLSIVVKGNYLPPYGWSGVVLAFAGIFCELDAKTKRKMKISEKTNSSPITVQC